MKANKVTLIIQAVGMYVMHLPLYVLLIALNLPLESGLLDAMTNALFIAALVLLILMIPVCVANIVTSIVSVFKHGADPTKTTMIVKLCLIPWYALNFVIGFVFVSILFNPFMMIAIPVVIALLVASTYILMLSTSLGDVTFIVRNKIKNDRPVDVTTVFAVLCLFIFCLDVLGSIILYRKNKRFSEETPRPEQTDDLGF